MRHIVKRLLFSAFIAGIVNVSQAQEITPSAKSWTGASGASWAEAANWSPEGVPTENDAVTIPASASVYIPESASVYSFDIAAGATLNLGSTGTAVNGGKATQASDTANNLTLTVVQNMTVAGDLSLGGINTTNKVIFAVGGNLSLSEGAAMAIYAGVVAELEDKTAYNGDGSTLTVGGDFTIAQNAWLYPWSQTTNAGTVRMTVNGNVTIDNGGGIDASTRGYEYRYGPGQPSYDFAAKPWTEGPGGSYGGKGGENSAATYGFANAPFNSGSPGLTKGASKGNPGGGSIRLHVAGNVNLSGSLLALGGGMYTLTDKQSAGSGGSVWVTCTKFNAAESAVVSAEGGYCNHAWCGGGGGGRICVLSGAPSSEQIDSLYRTGTCDDLFILNENVDATTGRLLGLYPADYQVNVKGGENTGHPQTNAKNGTAVIAMIMSDDVAQVTISSDPDGIVVAPHAVPNSGQTVVIQDETMDFSAITPSFAVGSDNESRYHCVGYVWSNSEGDTDEGEETSVTLNATDGTYQSLIWKWGRLEHHLTVNINGGGSVNGERWWAEGSTATVTAVPDEGYKFVCWAGDIPHAELSNPTLSVKMDTPVVISAVFIPVGTTYLATAKAIADGEWFNPGTWEGGIIPGAESDVTISGRKVQNTYPIDVEAKSLTITNSAKLFLWGDGDGAVNQEAVSYSDNWDIDLTLDVKGDILVDGSSELSIGGLDSAYRPTVNSGGSLTITNNSAFAVYAGNVATNNLVSYAKGGAKINIGGTVIVGGSSWVYPFSHYTTGASPLFKAKSCFIAENSGFDADGKGYGCAVAPGSVYLKGGPDGWGASYGGVPGLYSSTVAYKEPYGYAWAPFWAGSPGTMPYGDNYDKQLYNVVKGGGAILIQVSRDFTVNGTLKCNGVIPRSGKVGRGSGGSIWIICRHFNVGTAAKISADGGSMYNASSTGPGGGGRICVMEGQTNTEKKTERLILTGTARGITELCADLTAEDSPYPEIFSVKGGENTSDYYGDAGQDYKKGKQGTAVLLKTSNAPTLILLQ